MPTSPHPGSRSDVGREVLFRRYVQEGMTLPEISRLYKIHPKTVHSRLAPLLTPEFKQQHKQAQRNRKLAQLPVARFRELVNQGLSRRDMCQQLGVSQSQLDYLMAGLGEAAYRQWQAQRINRQQRYSDEEMAASLLEAAQLLRRRQFGIVTYEQLRRSHSHLIPAALYSARGGWNWWRQRVGLPVNARSRSPAFGAATYSSEDYRAGMQYVCSRLGNRLFSHAEYEANRRSTDPTGSSMRLRDGRRHTWLGSQEEFLPQLFRRQ